MKGKAVESQRSLRASASISQPRTTTLDFSVPRVCCIERRIRLGSALQLYGRTRGVWNRVVHSTVESTKPPGNKGMGMKSQETKVQPLSVTLSAEQEKLLSRIASRLLNLRAGTPVTYTRK